MHVNDFPPEILIHVFQQATGGSSLTIFISQVCRAWRGIALDSPLLWNDLRISSGSSLYKLDQLFARSRGLIVSVTVDCRAPATPLAHNWKLLKGVVAHRARIGALDFVAPQHVLSMLSRVVIGNQFPHLQRLHVVQAAAPRVRPEDEIVWRVPLWKMTFDSPHLRSLSIDAVIPTNHERFRFLRELRIKESGYFMHEIPVDHLLGLQTLSIAASPLPSLTGFPADSQLASFTLSDLRTIDNPRGTLTRLLETVRMPALQHLVVDGLSGYLWNELVRWLADAEYPALRSVALEAVQLSDMGKQHLHAFATVSALRLSRQFGDK
ncbi:hypothetical protein B0H15DRAFT_403005 [Mycena belliarum]|uniref:F-box domain-containing protein n=1 Tax=Mycena belliarum TaxID=1033014 RepID=A0AAD6TZR7_9AGAR|nr:hypothetical protein B0H15DRAFT_403005 [Mycena belliae]